MAPKDTNTNAGGKLVTDAPAHDDANLVRVGPASVAEDMLKGLAPEGFNKNGVVLVGQTGRVKVTLMHGNVPVTYTLSLYVQRDALNADESAKVDKAAKERKQSADEKKLATQAEREREIKRATDLTADIFRQAQRELNAERERIENAKKIING